MMRRILDQLKKHREVLLYVVFGGLTTLVNFLVFMLCTALAGQKYYLWNNAIAWIVSVLFAYVTNKLFVFQSKSCATKVIAKELTGFVAARIFSFGVEELGMWLCVDIWAIGDLTLFTRTITGQMIAKILLAVIVVILNYFFSKFLVFSRKEKQ